MGIDGRCFEDGSAFRGTGRQVGGALSGLSAVGGGDLDDELVAQDSAPRTSRAGRG